MGPKPKLTLVDVSHQVVDAWHEAFHPHSEVSILEGNIVELARDTVVSPANGYGDMGGGVDLAYRRHFGSDIQRRVQARIEEVCGSYLPVGEALLVDTGDENIPRMIVAPTMFLPEPTDADSVFAATRAALSLARQHNDLIAEIFCPGFGTGVGRVAPKAAADAMARAYREFA